MKKNHWIVVLSATIAAVVATLTTIALVLNRKKKVYDD